MKDEDIIEYQGRAVSLIALALALDIPYHKLKAALNGGS